MKVKTEFGYLYVLFLVCCFFSSTEANSQEVVPFKMRHQSYIKGDMGIIANNIVNRKTNRHEATEPYNDLSDKAKMNDEFEMTYIDIDTIETTFSSSSADFLPENHQSKKIVYAGLYWAANYKYNSGIRDKYWRYKATDNERELIDVVELQLPGNDFYNEIKGEIIFDGHKDRKFRESAPYVVFADITDYVKKVKNPFGTYTVANVRATEGVLPGGVAAGWTIFFIYEDPYTTPKSITVFDGFAGITSRAVEIHFDGFKSLPYGEVKSKIALAALEGDYNLDGDQLEIKSGHSANYTRISHPLKPENNFFNSTIVIGDSYYKDRNPNSLNTLGYDTCLISIDNPDNSVIQNNSDTVSLRLKTSGDKYNMFFSAFNIEIFETETISEEPVFADNQETDTEETVAESSEDDDWDSLKAFTSNVDVDEENVLAESNNTTNNNQEDKNLTAISKTAEKKLVAENTTNKTTDSLAEIISEAAFLDPISQSEKINAETPAVNGKKRITAIPGSDVAVSNQIMGYYVIANVFAVHNNATRFTQRLQGEHKIDANFFINPTNNYRYVYVDRHDTWLDALKTYYSNVNGKYFDDLWIMLVNTTDNATAEAIFMYPPYQQEK
ncbi:MAG: hypothetical protein RBR78_02155 [Flavobacteriaceae bacterium]|jgi:hypothetical protein|nr:hypothetical protein [Flavobacteriaceae bacterium]